MIKNNSSILTYHNKIVKEEIAMKQKFIDELLQYTGCGDFSITNLRVFFNCCASFYNTPLDIER